MKRSNKYNSTSHNEIDLIAGYYQVETCLTMPLHSSKTHWNQKLIENETSKDIGKSNFKAATDFRSQMGICISMSLKKPILMIFFKPEESPTRLALHEVIFSLAEYCHQFFLLQKQRPESTCNRQFWATLEFTYSTQSSNNWYNCYMPDIERNVL